VSVRAILGLAAAAAALIAVPTSPAAVTPIRWCGNDVAQVDRVRDRVGGAQVHVVYAIPADGQDRFGQLASGLATDVAAIDAWWRREDPSRAPRFDLFDFPGCESRAGLLDLSSVRLPEPASSYASLGGRFGRIAGQLGGVPFGLASAEKKYLVFYDGVVPGDDVCGTGAGSERRGPSYAVVYLRSSCDLTVGEGRGAAFVGAHELLHALGAVDDPAPHSCEGGHVCDSPVDLMSASYGGELLETARLDVGRDDYYGHPGPWFDIQDSGWLLHAAAQFSLTLRLTGAGTIGSEPDGQGCRSTCTIEWNGGTSVQLAAEAAAGHAFGGWTGPCAAEREPSCLVTVGQNLEVGAIFRPLRRLAILLTGRGRVTAAGVRCTRTCSPRLAEGARVTLRATPASGWRFVRWTGLCGGSRPTCSVRVGMASRVGAVFARRA
jgi:Divergent InlB B-repeat domain